MKTPVPITLKDLQATAKDDKRGLCLYGYLKIYWDDATDSYNYWFRDEVIDVKLANHILSEH